MTRCSASTWPSNHRAPWPVPHAHDNDTQRQGGCICQRLCSSYLLRSGLCTADLCAACDLPIGDQQQDVVLGAGFDHHAHGLCDKCGMQWWRTRGGWSVHTPHELLAQSLWVRRVARVARAGDIGIARPACPRRGRCRPKRKTHACPWWWLWRRIIVVVHG